MDAAIAYVTPSENDLSPEEHHTSSWFERLEQLARSRCDKRVRRNRVDHRFSNEDGGDDAKGGGDDGYVGNCEYDDEDEVVEAYDFQKIMGEIIYRVVSMVMMGFCRQY